MRFQDLERLEVKVGGSRDETGALRWEGVSRSQ